MFGTHFYHSSIRKYVITFGTLFNDIVVQRNNSAGELVQALAVPISYGPKESFLVRMREDENLEKPVAITLPRIGFQITGIDYAPGRKLSSTVRNKIHQNQSDTNAQSQYVPVPYDITFQLSVFVRNTADGLQILEQILPYFTPAFTASVNIIPEMDIKVDAPVEITNVNMEEIYEGDLVTRQSLVYDITFIMKGHIYGPITTKGVIQRSITNIRDNDDGEVLAQIINTTDGTTINENGYSFDPNLNNLGDVAQSITYTKKLQLFDVDKSHSICITTPGVLNTNWNLVLPGDSGEDSQVLQTNGEGVTSWVSLAGAGNTFDQIKLTPDTPEGVNEFMNEVLGDISGAVSNNELATAFAVQAYANNVISDLDGGIY